MEAAIGIELMNKRFCSLLVAFLECEEPPSFQHCAYSYWSSITLSPDQVALLIT